MQRVDAMFWLLADIPRAGASIELDVGWMLCIHIISNVFAVGWMLCIDISNVLAVG
jgi:hypothetical protein